MLQVFNRKILLLFLALVILCSCEELFELPREKDYLSPRADYTQKVLEPVLGRTTLFSGIFNADNSSNPLEFEIINARYGDGRPMTSLFQVKPALVWTGAYTGDEASLAEIEKKRKLENRPLFEVRSSGEFVLWSTATNELVEPRDSIMYSQDIMFFDVKISNSGGVRILRDLQIIPWRERPYEPHDDLNEYTGEPAMEQNSSQRQYIYPNVLEGMTGVNSNQELTNNIQQGRDVRVYFRKIGEGNSLTFKFLDSDSVAINPALFNETKWETLVHGFNMEKTSEYVKYDVAYPIPLVRIPTRYTNDGLEGNGSQAYVEFIYSRKGFGGMREIGQMALNFNIYEAGDWVILFHFHNEEPKFEDE